MRAERFGSYSIAGNLGRNRVLVSLEIDDSVVTALRPTTAMARGDATDVISACGLLERT